MTETNTEAGDLLRDTRVVPDPARAGRYRAQIPGSWNILYAFGGVTMATAVQAARAALTQPDFGLLSASAAFLSPITAGPAVADVRRLRAGKGSEQMAVDLRSGDGDGDDAQCDVHAMVSFGPERDNDTRFVEVEMPDVAAPEDTHPPLPPPGHPFLKLPYHKSVEIKSCSDRAPWNTDWEPGEARWTGWFRFANTPRLPSGMLDPLAYIPPCDMIGPALLHARGPKAPPQLVVSLEITVHFLALTDSEWLLSDTRCTQAGGGYASGSVQLWDRHGQLVAYAAQRALMRRLPEGGIAALSR